VASTALKIVESNSRDVMNAAGMI